MRTQRQQVSLAYKKKCAKLYFKLAYNIDILMFESNEFLDCYLPQFLQSVVSRLQSKSLHPDTSLETLKMIIKFIKMSHQLYSSVSNQASFETFLVAQFPFWDQAPSITTFSKTSSINDNMINTFRLIKSKIDQLSTTSLSLFVKLVYINSQTTWKKIQNQKKINFSNELTQLCCKIRLNYQLIKMTGEVNVEFDEYIECVVGQFISMGMSKDMESIMKDFASNQNSNFSEKIKNKIEKLVHSDQFILHKSGDQWKQSAKQTVKKSETDVSTMLRKTKKKKISIQTKLDSTPTKKNAIKLEKNRKRGRQNSISPHKDSSFIQRQLPSPAKRIQEVVKNNKVKPIQKKRTIYFERTNVYFRKNKDWIDKPQGLFSETSIGSSERLVDLRNSREEIIVDQFDDDESILVRSTPKMSKKLQIRAICHKLEF